MAKTEWPHAAPDPSLGLPSGASAARWKKSGAEADARAAAQSLRVVGTRKTALAPEVQPLPETPRHPRTSCIRHQPRLDVSPQAPSDYRFGKTTGPSSMKSRNDGPDYSKYAADDAD